MTWRPGFPDCASGGWLGRIRRMENEKEIHALAQRILVKAAIKLGGSGALSKHLGIDEATLGDWLAGRSVPPAETVLKAIAPLVDEAATLLRDPAISRPGVPQ